MEKASVKKLSLLGLMLAAGSVITAAILPAKAENNKRAVGKIKPGTHGFGQTCTEDQSKGTVNCIYDTASAETSAANNTSGITTAEG